MIALFLGSTTLCSPALAQDQIIELQEITVEGGSGSPLSGGTGYTAGSTTAGFKGGVPVAEVPRSVSVVTAQELKDRNPAQIEDAVAYVPGVAASNWGVDDRFDQFMIRGFDTGSTGIFRDGLIQKTINFSSYKTDPFLVERIDVLRGPSGVLYGPGSAGGMVNIITKRPRFEDHAEGQLQFGSHNTGQVALDMGGPVGDSDTLAWRLIALSRSGANEIEGSEDDRNLVSLGVTWAPADATEVTFLGHYQQDELTPNFLFPVAGEDYDASLGDLPDSFTYGMHDFNGLETESWSLGYQARHDVNGLLTLRQNLRYGQQDTEYRHLYFGWMADADTMEFNAFTVFERATTLAIDTQAEFRGGLAGGDNTLLAGFDYYRQQYDGTQGWAMGYQIDVSDPNYDFPVTDPAIYQDQKNTVDQKGLYLQNHTRFDSGITVTAGLRKSWVETETVDRLGGTTTTQEDDALTGSIGATWDLGNGFIPYAGYTEGFETNIGTDFFGAMFRPSDSEQFELGLRYLPGAGDLLLSAALFDLTKTNVLTTDTDNPGFQVQTGEVRHKGLELEARGRLGSNLSAIFSYSYIDAEITRSNDGDQGNRTAKVPEHQASLWLDYAFDGGLSGWSMGGGLRYVGASSGDRKSVV